MKRLNIMTIFLLVTVWGCGDSDVEAPDSGLMVGSECVDLTGCGAGKPNARDVSFCENCFSRPDTHVCEAGICRALDTSGRIDFLVGVPPSARGAQSWTQVSLNPIRADGVRVNCAELLQSSDYQNNHVYNAGNSNFRVFATQGGADPALAYPSFIAADVGLDRLLIVRVVSGTQGKGMVLAQGCVEGIEVKAGETTDVSIVLDAP